MTKVITSLSKTLKELKVLFNEIVIVEWLCFGDKEEAKEFTLRRFLAKDALVGALSLLLVCTLLALFA